MAVVRPFVFQVVGFQNSGKTTLSEQLIRILADEGQKVSAIKHHGHGGTPQVTEGKDSSRHMEAGAIASVVEGGGTLLLHGEQARWDLDIQIALLSVLGPDFILIEGHKHASYPKVVLLRNQEDEKLLKKLSSILAVLYWEHKPHGLNGIPAFSIKSQTAACEIGQIILEKAKGN